MTAAPALPLAAKIAAFILSGAVFLVLLFLKLCYSTALYATLAEINRRIAVFRQGRRPVLRAILLLPSVIFFCSAVLFLLCAPLVVVGDAPLNFSTLMNLKELAFAFLRIGFILAAVVMGAVLGIMVGRNVTLGRDRFGGILCNNRGRYLAFWLFAFTLCGFFRLMPWGFITYWTIWLLVLAACLVTAAHWTLYSACRMALAAPAPGLPPGEALSLSLRAREAVAVAALMRGKGPQDLPTMGRALSQPDPAWLAHPAWCAELQVMVRDQEALRATIEALAARGLAAHGPRGWIPSGASERLRRMGFVETAAGLTLRMGGGARTVVLQRQGPTLLLLEPSPTALTIRELGAGADPAEALSTAVI